jgi:cell division protein FtsQ
VTRYASGRRDGSEGYATGLLTLLILFLLTAAGVAWVSMGIVASERWPIRWLEVNGAFQRVSAEQLRASLASRVGANFFTVDLQSLQAAALRISWVSAVRVQKQWPDTVRVEVEEYVPVAHWNSGQLITGTGGLFAVPEADGIQGLPWLEGPDGRLGEVLETWAGFDGMLLPLGLEITRLKLDNRGAWSLELSNDTWVQLGRESSVERLQRLLASWETLTREKDVPPVGVDLRYANGFAVEWPQPADEQEKPGRVGI